MIRIGSYKINKGEVYTLANFGGSGVMLCVPRTPTQMSVSVSIDRTQMAPVRMGEPWTTDGDAIEIVFDADAIITAYKEQ